MATNIKDKIAKLLALAESPNENEAKAALLKARELMAEHKLRPEEMKDPTDPPGTYREKCNAYGWGFVHGVNAAFREQQEEHQEWGLVMVVPKAVDDSMADMGKKSSFGKERTGGWRDAYRALGYQAGRDFDPNSRLSGGQHRKVLGVGV